MYLTVLAGHGMLLFPTMHVYAFALMHGQRAAWRLPCFWKMSVLFYEKHSGEYIIYLYTFYISLYKLKSKSTCLTSNYWITFFGLNRKTGWSNSFCNRRRKCWWSNLHKLRTRELHQNPRKTLAKWWFKVKFYSIFHLLLFGCCPPITNRKKNELVYFCSMAC